MKIRNGFVSNSSSSSFVVKIKDMNLPQFIACVKMAYQQQNLIKKDNEDCVEFPEYLNIEEYLEENNIPYEKRL